MSKMNYPPVLASLSDEAHLKTSRRSFQGQSSKRKILLVATLLALVLSPVDAYFMKCKHFCSMLTKDELKQLWCIYDMCRNDKLGKHLLRYAKRARGDQSDIASPLLDEGYAASRDLSHGRKQRFSIAPGSAIYRAVPKSLETFETPDFPVHAKRDVEYWDGPAPAEINA